MSLVPFKEDKLENLSSKRANDSQDQLNQKSLEFFYPVCSVKLTLLQPDECGVTEAINISAISFLLF